MRFRKKGTDASERPQGARRVCPLFSRFSCENGRQECLPQTLGLTLVELLIAMGIFLIIMSGVTLLFANASSSVTQANMAMEGYESARASMARLERDFSLAFVSRETGSTNHFYGQPNGLCFTGALESGRLSRITYAIQPRHDKAFNTTTSQPIVDLINRAKRYDQRRGIANSDPKSAELALGQYLTAKEIVWTPDSVTNVELPIRVVPAALIRYEESGAADLETFPLPSADNKLVWPNIEVLWDNRNDDTPAISPDDPLYCEMHKALIQAGSAVSCPISSYDLDIRKLLDDNQTSPTAPKMSMLGPKVVKAILTAKRPELWLRLIVNNWQYDEFAAACRDSGLKLPVVSAPEDYELIGNVLWGAFMDEDPLLYPGFAGFDVLEIPPLFQYTDGNYVKDQPVVTNTFNALENIAGYTGFFQGPLGIDGFDIALQTAADSGTDVGSPMDLRLPYSVEVGFWIMLESRSPSVNDFRQWFTQIIEIPSAFTRGK